MATTKIKTELISDGAVTSNKLDTNISIAGNVSVGLEPYTSSGLLNLKGSGLALKNDLNGGGNNWSLIQNQATTDSASIDFISGQGLAMTIAHDKNVGIGTITPTAPMTVSKSVLGATTFSTEQVSIFNNQTGVAGNEATIGFHLNNSSWGSATTFARVSAQLENGSTGASSLVFGTAENGASATATERMRIDSSGNVGINESNPDSNNVGVDRVLQITSTRPSIRLKSSYSPSGADCEIVSEADGAMVLRNHYQSGNISLMTNDSERMRITSGGNILVGGSVDYSRISVSNGNSTRTGITLSDENTASLMLFAGNNSDAVIAIDTQNLSFKTGATAGQDNGTERMRLQTNGDLHVDGDVIAYSTTISDERLKDDIQTIDNALDKVSNLRGVSYTWNNGKRKGQKDLGLIAQEVEQVLPELVREKEMPMIDGGTYKTVDYEKIVGVLIEAVKELKAEVESLKSK
jgi:hypothetical protein